jgi:cytochrome c6
MRTRAGGTTRSRSPSPEATAALWLLALLLSACGGAADREAEARLARGREVFTELSRPRCTICHALRDAGADARVGPDLDRLRPDSLRVAAAVSRGVGIMPAQGDHLTPDQIRVVAAYVATVAGKAEGSGAR